jgi:hypothetical protein
MVFICRLIEHTVLEQYSQMDLSKWRELATAVLDMRFALFALRASFTSKRLLQGFLLSQVA